MKNTAIILLLSFISINGSAFDVVDLNWEKDNNKTESKGICDKAASNYMKELNKLVAKGKTDQSSLPMLSERVEDGEVFVFGKIVVNKAGKKIVKLTQTKRLDDGSNISSTMTFAYPKANAILRLPASKNIIALNIHLGNNCSKFMKAQKEVPFMCAGETPKVVSLKEHRNMKIQKSFDHKKLSAHMSKVAKFHVEKGLVGKFTIKKRKARTCFLPKEGEQNILAYRAISGDNTGGGGFGGGRSEEGSSSSYNASVAMQ